MCRICEIINNVSCHTVAIIIVVVATDLVTRVLSAFTFTFCAFTFTDRTDKIHSPAEFITAAICTTWLWCRLFHAPTRTTSSGYLMLHRLALVVRAGCPLLPPLPPRQHPQCPPVDRTVKTTLRKTCWSFDLENRISPNISILKTCHLYRVTSSNIFLGELLVGDRASISSLSFSIIFAVVTFQRVEKVFPGRCFSLTLFWKHFLDMLKRVGCRKDTLNYNRISLSYICIKLSKNAIFVNIW